jgi:hypothetical protein
VAVAKDYGSRLKGTYYTDFLANLLEKREPRTYPEIGSESGASLALPQCASIAIDPHFVLTQDVVQGKPMCLLFQQSSDRFFAERDAASLLGGPIDIALIDGMHLFEVALRDFINVERYCQKNSLIILHDCLPPHIDLTVRNPGHRDPAGPYPGAWAGDVWKLLPMLSKHRPELSVTCLDCAPTGLVVVTNLDPQNGVLPQAYEDIVGAERTDILEFERFDHLWQEIQIVLSQSLAAFDQLSARFWV